MVCKARRRSKASPRVVSATQEPERYLYFLAINGGRGEGTSQFYGGSDKCCPKRIGMDGGRQSRIKRSAVETPMIRDDARNNPKRWQCVPAVRRPGEWAQH